MLIMRKTALKYSVKPNYTPTIILIMQKSVSQSFTNQNANTIRNLDTMTFVPGSRWVGWNKTMTTDEEVTLTFNFSETRLFYHVDIHTNNMFTKDVQVTTVLWLMLCVCLCKIYSYFCVQKYYAVYKNVLIIFIKRFAIFCVRIFFQGV